MFNTFVEHLKCEVASSPTSLTTCSDDPHQQIVPEFGKGVWVHSPLRIFGKFLIFLFQLFGLRAVRELPEVFCRKSLSSLSRTSAFRRLNASVYALGHESSLSKADCTWRKSVSVIVISSRTSSCLATINFRNSVAGLRFSSLSKSLPAKKLFLILFMGRFCQSFLTPFGYASISYRRRPTLLA